MTAPFVIDLGFTRNDYAAIVKGVGLAATLIGGFAGGFVARAYPLATSLWIGALLQASPTSCSPGRRWSGYDIAWLTVAIITENFTSAIGTVIFVAYLSALCQNPLHTATQYALLTALCRGRPHLSVVGRGLRRRGHRLGLVLRDQRAGRAAEPAAALVAAGARALRAAARQAIAALREACTSGGTDLRIRSAPATPAAGTPAIRRGCPIRTARRRNGPCSRR